MLSRWMVFIDPPAHTRLRRLVGQAFTPQRVAGLAADIRASADGLLDSALESGDTFDVIADLTYPLPIIVASRILAVPPEDPACLKAWSAGLSGDLETGYPDTHTPDYTAVATTLDYMDRLIRRHRPPTHHT